jgi:hypothetical protein
MNMNDTGDRSNVITLSSKVRRNAAELRRDLSAALRDGDRTAAARMRVRLSEAHTRAGNPAMGVYEACMAWLVFTREGLFQDEARALLAHAEAAEALRDLETAQRLYLQARDRFGTARTHRVPRVTRGLERVARKLGALT